MVIESIQGGMWKKFALGVKPNMKMVLRRAQIIGFSCIFIDTDTNTVVASTSLHIPSLLTDTRKFKT